jgi:hypothetical protein
MLVARRRTAMYSAFTHKHFSFHLAGSLVCGINIACQRVTATVLARSTEGSRMKFFISPEQSVFVPGRNRFRLIPPIDQFD